MSKKNIFSITLNDNNKIIIKGYINKKQSIIVFITITSGSK